MGRKKKKASKPWCWYCNREFDDEKILVQHQKAKHFKCNICHKKLYTGPGLSIHCMQVHKETIDKVPNSIPNRSNIEIEIFGMDGIPAEDLKEHERQKTGGKSDSDDEEPTNKRGKLEGQQPIMMPNMMPPHMMAQFGMPPMGMPQFIPMMPMPHQMMPSRPLFPAAVPSSTMQHQIPQRPTFPAYSNATISAPPTTNNSGINMASTSGQEHAKIPPSSIPPTGTASKIMHPSEDLSLEEIRARKPKYLKQVTTARANAIFATNSQNHQRAQQQSQTNQQIMQIDQLNQSHKEQIQRLREHHEEQQQLTDEINRAVMFQRMQQISRTSAQMGMVPTVTSNPLPLMQPMMRPTMALAPTPSQFAAHTMMRPGHPATMGIAPGLIAPMSGMVAPGAMGMMLPASPMMPMMPRFR